MKTLKYIVLALGTVGMLVSCDSMEDSYKDYLQGGEIVYRAKAKDVVGYSGYNRAKLTWILEYPTQVVKCQLREGDDVLAEIPVQYQDKLELEYILDNLSEKTHTISVYSLDSEGNRSVKSDVIIDVYGDRYISTLRTGRTVETVLRQMDNPAKALVRLSTNASSKVVATEIYYKSVSGAEKHQRIDAGANELILEDVAADSYFNLSDIWKPSDTAIDDFPASLVKCDASDIPMELARSFMSIYKTDATTVVANLTSARTDGGVVRSIIRYGGKEITVEPATMQAILTDVPSDAVISMETIVEADGREYVTAVISVEANTLVTKIAMTNWEVLDFSSQQESGEGAGGGHASHSIDGDLSTYWHTQYSPSKPSYPHHLTIDLKEAATIKAVAVARRNGNNNFPAKMRLELSSDNTNWGVAGEFVPDNSIDGLQMFTLDNSLSGRYIRLTGLSSATNQTHMCLSELNLFK